MRCKKHKDYRAILRPRADCPVCREMFLNKLRDCLEYHKSKIIQYSKLLHELKKEWHDG